MEAAGVGCRGWDVGARREPFAVGNEQRLVVRTDRDGRRIPADRDETFDYRNRFAIAPGLLGKAVRDIDDHHAVIVGVGHKQRAPIRGNGDSIGRAPFRGIRIERGGDDLAGSLGQTAGGTGVGFGSLYAARLDDVNSVVAGTSDKEAAIGGKGQIVRPEADLDLADAAGFFCVDDTHCPTAPVTDVQMSAIGAQDA